MLLLLSAGLSLPVLPKQVLLLLVDLRNCVVSVVLRLMPFAWATWRIKVPWSCSLIVAIPSSKLLRYMCRLLLVF